LDKKSVFPSDEFGPCEREILARATTVMLPYPPPASGRLFIGINPDFIPPDSKLGLVLAGGPKFFLRLVQVVSPTRVIIRIVDLEALRGVSLPTNAGLREFRTVSSIAADIASAVQKLTGAEAKKSGVYEVCLFEDAVIFVPESAPVFVRIQQDFGVSAAEAAENVDGRIEPRKGCGCTMYVPFPVGTLVEIARPAEP
jgi:hypothetical protein